MLGINLSIGEVVVEYVYFLEKFDLGSSFNVDKIGDVVYGGNGKFFVVERDFFFDFIVKKFIFEIDFKGVINLFVDDVLSLLEGEILE